MLYNATQGAMTTSVRWLRRESRKLYSQEVCPIYSDKRLRARARSSRSRPRAPIAEDCAARGLEDFGSEPS
eukprot:1880-Alexandrium_andersonii.AAC.1